MTKNTTPDFSAPDSKIPSWVAAWLKALSSKKSVSNPNSPTPPSERESESCLKRTVKKWQPSFPGTVASTIFRKTTRCWWLVSVRKESQKEIFRESDSKCWLWKAFLWSPFSQARRRRNDRIDLITNTNNYLSVKNKDNKQCQEDHLLQSALPCDQPKTILEITWSANLKKISLSQEGDKRNLQSSKTIESNFLKKQNCSQPKL